VTDRILLSANIRNFDQCIALATDYGLGIEVMAFAFPDTLDGDWRTLATRYMRPLQSVKGRLTMHGPFMDMAPGSPDKRVNQVCAERYQAAIRIGAELGIELIVFHANFIANIHTQEYRQGWQRRNVDFWGPLADYARYYGLTIAVENMWEFDPDIIGDVVKQLNHPHLRACLDVGHAHLYGEVPFDHWLNTLEPVLDHAHINNNDGKMDFHRGLAEGVLDYQALLQRMRSLLNPPSFTLEMDQVEAMVASLPFLELPT
jgi:sugar phosphate isomerase/epimerase